MWEANQQLRGRVEEMKKGKGKREERPGEIVEGIRREEKEKVRKIEELKKLIQEYRFLCEEAVRFTSSQPSPGPHSETTKSSTMTPSRSRSLKKIKTRIFCQSCSRHFFPQEYYLHCKDCHSDSGYQTLRS
jgi:Zn finger protein HypA/HybF involved in hydrogenase expression